MLVSIHEEQEEKQRVDMYLTAMTTLQGENTFSNINETNSKKIYITETLLMAIRPRAMHDNFTRISRKEYNYNRLTFKGRTQP